MINVDAYNNKKLFEHIKKSRKKQLSFCHDDWEIHSIGLYHESNEDLTDNIYCQEEGPYTMKYVKKTTAVRSNEMNHELFKHGSNELWSRLHHLITNTWDS